jgi:hypothetical protein
MMDFFLGEKSEGSEIQLIENDYICHEKFRQL